jgi:hypothetical protein
LEAESPDAAQFIPPTSVLNAQVAVSNPRHCPRIVAGRIDCAIEQATLCGFHRRPTFDDQRVAAAHCRALAQTKNMAPPRRSGNDDNAVGIGGLVTPVSVNNFDDKS